MSGCGAPFWRISAHLVRRQVEAPLCGGSRPLTAQKGVQRLENWKIGADVAVAPFLEDLGRSRLKKGSSAWKKVKVWADVAVAPFLEDLGRTRRKKGSSGR